MKPLPAMNLQRQSIPRSKSRGAILLLAMVFLLLLAMIAGSAMQTSIMEFQMAGNDQFREEAFQKAQAIVAAISEDSKNFPVSGGVGHTICTSGCDTNRSSLVDAAVEAVHGGVVVSYRVERQGPLILESLPFRLSESSASSSLAYDAALFESSVEIDGSNVKLGRAEVVQGVAIVVASSSQ